jgi:predicted nucleic-acid-binding Zn-ribbon protein
MSDKMYALFKSCVNCGFRSIVTTFFDEAEPGVYKCKKCGFHTDTNLHIMHTGDFSNVSEGKIKEVEKIACSECKDEALCNRKNGGLRNVNCILYSVNWTQPGIGKLENHLGIFE